MGTATAITAIQQPRQPPLQRQRKSIEPFTIKRASWLIAKPIDRWVWSDSRFGTRTQGERASERSETETGLTERLVIEALAQLRWREIDRPRDPPKRTSIQGQNRGPTAPGNPDDLPMDRRALELHEPQFPRVPYLCALYIELLSFRKLPSGGDKGHRLLLPANLFQT